MYTIFWFWPFSTALSFSEILCFCCSLPECKHSWQKLYIFINSEFLDLKLLLGTSTKLFQLAFKISHGFNYIISIFILLLLILNLHCPPISSYLFLWLPITSIIESALISHGIYCSFCLCSKISTTPYGSLSHFQTYTFTLTYIYIKLG